VSYPSNRYPRERQHSYFEDDEQERSAEGRGRSYLSERSPGFRSRRPGERDSRETEHFGERRYLDPYSGRSIGRDDDYRERERERERDYATRQQGYAPYPYGEEPPLRNLEDWQRPWQLGEERAYGTRSFSQRSYGTRGYGTRSAQSGGLHRGRGPKGYQRSDERLREDICERLTDDPDIDATEIGIEVSSGEVTLSGSVPDRHMKRAAEDLIEECSGVKQVHNGLRIEAEREPSSAHERYAGSPTTRH
jgi:hypothetical protein